MLKRFRHLILSAIIFLSGIGLWLYHQSHTIHILPYEALRDRAFIEKLFHRDWYWLTDQEYDPTLLALWLDNKSPTADPSTFGTLTIHVAQKDHADVGFVAYFLKSAQEGLILFIDVEPMHRSKHIGKALLDFAINNLKARGAKRVQLITRQHNTAARRLYDRSGFSLRGQTADYVFYEKKLIP